MQVWMMRIAAFGAAFLNFVGAVFPVMSLGKATITHLVFVDDLHWSLALAFFSIEQLAVEWLWARPCSVHQAHHNSFVLGEISRLLGALGGKWTLSGMLNVEGIMLNVEA